MNTKRAFTARYGWLVTVLALLAIMASSLVFTFTARAAHIPAHYTVTYTDTNFYHDTGVRWFLSDLDPTEDYSFRVEILNIETGAVMETFGNNYEFSGVSTGTIDAFIFPETFKNTTVPLVAPVRLVDNFGNVVSYHFVAPNPNDTGAGDWVSTATHAPVLYDRIGIASVPYLQGNAGEQFHSFTSPEFSITNLNDVTLLHYQLPEATTTEDELIVLRSMLDGVPLATFSLDELLRYNHPSCNTDCESGDAFADLRAQYSFVVLSTNQNGSRPWYIDPVTEANAFDAIFSIPHRMSVPLGVYDYAKLTAAGALVALGESPWIVSSTANLQSPEWNLEVLFPKVQTDHFQRAFLRSATEAVWRAMIEQILVDSAVPDDTDLADGLLHAQYATDREIRWDVGDDHIGTHTVQWLVQPTLLNWATTTVDYGFVFAESHEVVTDATPTVTLLSFLDRWNLANPFGILALTTIALLVVFAMFKRSTPPILYGLTYALVSIVLIMSSLLPLTYDILLGLTAVLAVPLTMKLRAQTED